MDKKSKTIDLLNKEITKMNKIITELRNKLQHEIDTVTGLWCTDKDPKEWAMFLEHYPDGSQFFGEKINLFQLNTDKDFFDVLKENGYEGVPRGYHAK